MFSEACEYVCRRIIIITKQIKESKYMAAVIEIQPLISRMNL
jgi:hypothetical protein